MPEWSPKPGWLGRQFKRVEEDMKQWPEWMKREVNKHMGKETEKHWSKEEIELFVGQVSKANAKKAWGHPGSAVEHCDKLLQIIRQLLAERDTPEIADFMKAVPLEAEHQRARWGTAHDAGKAPADWYWLIGYLAGKALHAHISGNTEKALHHTISTSAALANWHMAILGKTDMRPGIDTPEEAQDAARKGEGQ